MTQQQRLNYLLDYLINERGNDISAEDFPDKRKLLRALMNVRHPSSISEEFLGIQDEFLTEENNSRHLVSIFELSDYNKNCKNIILWQGDIITLKVDAIVNAANDAMLGCFIPNHACIDNVIHSAAGVQLREDCNQFMKLQGHREKTGDAKITKAYNLPCKHVIHTVGPIVDVLKDKHKQDLASCYVSCLDLAIKNSLKSIAFCCISTGEFRFPNKEAAEIAIKTVKDYLSSNNTDIKVVFNVFKDVDYELYKQLL